MIIKMIASDGKVFNIPASTLLIESDAGNAVAFFSQVGGELAFATAKDEDFAQSLAAFGIPVPKVEVSSCRQSDKSC